MPRHPRKLANRMDDPGFARTVERLLQEQRHALPNEHALNVAAEVKPSDVDRATDLWRAAQMRAGTGLEDLLDAKPLER